MRLNCPSGIKKDLIIGLVGAVFGSILTLFVDGWSGSQERLNQAKLESLKIEIYVLLEVVNRQFLACK